MELFSFSDYPLETLEMVLHENTSRSAAFQNTQTRISGTNDLPRLMSQKFIFLTNVSNALGIHEHV